MDVFEVFRVPVEENFTIICKIHENLSKYHLSKKRFGVMKYRSFLQDIMTSTYIYPYE